MIVGAVLAGGRSSRMGFDKAGATVGAATLLDITSSRLAAQVRHVAVNTNKPASLAGTEATRDIAVIPDGLGGFQGPLAGILAALTWAQTIPGASRLATVSVDSPLFPADFVETLRKEVAAAADPRNCIVIARSDGRLHPTCGLWPVTVRPALESFLSRHETRRITAFLDGQPVRVLDFAFTGIDPFFNVNTPDDLERLRMIMEPRG